MDIDEAVKFLAFIGRPLAKKSVYKLTSANRIPFSKSGKSLRFRKTELVKWVDNLKKANGKTIGRNTISIPVKNNNIER